MKCYYCENENRVEWSGYFCTTCLEIKAISKVYSYTRILEILQSLLIRDEENLNISLLKNKKKKKEEVEKMDDSTYQLRSKDPLPPL